MFLTRKRNMKKMGLSRRSIRNYGITNVSRRRAPVRRRILTKTRRSQMLFGYSSRGSCGACGR